MTLRTGLIVGCSALMIGGLVVATLIGAWFVHIAEDPEGLWITAEVADVVHVGEKLTLVVKATNRLSDRAIQLGDLDISDAYLRGFSIVSVDPTPKSTELDTFNDCTSTRFAVSLAPGATAEFRFTLQAERVGRYRGQIDQFVGMQALSAVVETEVRRQVRTRAGEGSET